MVLTVKDVMDRDFLVGPGTTTVDDASRQMVASRHGYFLLVDGGRPAGIVTEWDLVEKVVAGRRDPATTTVAEIASAPVIACDEAESTDEVIARMVAKGIRRMVVTGGGQVVGVFGAKDVLRIFQQYVDRVSGDIARMQSSLP
jgi:CBS domain-containing protein